MQKGWSKDDFNAANDLLSESTPYRLHDSMFLVGYLYSKKQQDLTLSLYSRLHSETKVTRSSMSTSSRGPKTLKSLDVTPRLSLGTAPTSVASKPQPLGTRVTRHSRCTLHTSRHRNGGLVHSEEPPIMLLSWLSSSLTARAMVLTPLWFRSVT